MIAAALLAGAPPATQDYAAARNALRAGIERLLATSAP
jgi:hypothetical protein